MPTEVATPWPSGPVVVSTPVVMWDSGWPGVGEPSWRKFLMSSRLIDGSSSDGSVVVDLLHPGQVDQRVEQHRGVAGREHEPVAVGPVRVGRVVAQVVLPDLEAERGQRHRRARVSGVGLVDRVDRKGPDRVDAQLVRALGCEGVGHARDPNGIGTRRSQRRARLRPAQRSPECRWVAETVGAGGAGRGRPVDLGDDVLGVADPG